MANDDQQNLSTEQCWEILGQEKYGRLAFTFDGEVHIAPINHVVQDEQILFQTGHGSKLTALDEQSVVAYEVDRIDDTESVSVVVRGFCVDASQEEVDRAFAEDKPWIDSPKVQGLAVVPQVVTGRRYKLHRS